MPGHAEKAYTGKVLIAADHAGYALKSALISAMPEVAWQDLGPASTERVDYPDYAETLARQLSARSSSQGASSKLISAGETLGVLICGSGVGMCIAANKFDGVRAALADNVTIAQLSREHNNANVICLGARFTAVDYAADILRAFFAADFSGGRHADRVRKISLIEAHRSPSLTAKAGSP